VIVSKGYTNYVLQTEQAKQLYTKKLSRNGMIHNIISFAKLDLVYKSVTLPSLFEIEKGSR
jgi:hypothetical protein